MTKTPVDMVSAIARGREGAGQPEGKRVHKRSAEALGRVPLFAGLSRRQLHHLAGVADEVRFRPGTTVIAEGDLGEALFVILEGAAKVVEQRIDLSNRNHQRRAKGDHVAQKRAHDQPLLLGKSDHTLPYPRLRLKRALCGPVGHQFDAADET